jgi:hypothetical protein
MEVFMIRTQVFLSKEQRDGLRAVSRTTGKTQSALMRDAIDQFLDLAGGNQRLAVLRMAAGLWANRRDIPDFDAQRALTEGADTHE